MPARSWKRVQPTSLRHAMQLCLDYARETQRLSVERVADRMGLPSHWSLYKWMEAGSLPARLIRPFEHACGCTYVTRWVAYSAHKLLIDIPTGHPAGDEALHALQGHLHEAVGLLMAFYRGESSTDETISALTVALEDLAHQRENVARAEAPELGLFEEGAP